jgi:hypothetical protein
VHDAHLPRARATRSARYGTRRGRWDRLSSLRASHSTQKKKKGKKEKRKKIEKWKMRKKDREKGPGFCRLLIKYERGRRYFGKPERTKVKKKSKKKKKKKKKEKKIPKTEIFRRAVNSDLPSRFPSPLSGAAR